MKALASIQATLSEGLLAAERVFALIDYTAHVTEKRGAAAAQGECRRRISFKDVDFAYEGGGPVLSGFNLEVPAGRKVALVGPSGAGKSTVLNLILRFFDPLCGGVAIDGQDLRDVTIASVRAASALLTQDPVLFDDTIAANIAYGSEGASEEEIAAAATAAAAHDFIMQLPRRLSDARRRGRQPAFRRRAPAHRLCARHAAQHADRAPRRADQRARRGIGGQGAGGHATAPTTGGRSS